MKLSVLFAVASFLVSAQGLEIFKRPTLDDAARVARTLISRESLANVNTVYQSGDDQGLPASFVEYYADCGDGNPVVLAVDIGTSFRNINQGSPVTLTVRTGDHAFRENVSREYPGSRPDSVAGSPRINLRGEFKAIESGPEYDELEKCFLKRHKDAAWWLPGNPIHKSHFVKFEVKEAYFLGGFGDTGYIGKIPAKDYHDAIPLDEIIDGENINVERIGDADIRDYAFEAYMLKHNVKHLTRSFYAKVSTQVDFFKSLINGETTIDDNVALDFSTEESDAILDIIKSNLEKRDGSDLSSLDVRTLSKEQLAKIVEELESLKTEIFQYAESLMKKFSVASEERVHHSSDRGDDPRPKKHRRPGPPKDGDRHHPKDHRGPPHGKSHHREEGIHNGVPVDGETFHDELKEEPKRGLSSLFSIFGDKHEQPKEHTAPHDKDEEREHRRAPKGGDGRKFRGPHHDGEKEHKDPHHGEPREHRGPKHGDEPREHRGPHRDDPREHRGPHRDDPREHKDPHHGEPREHRGPHRDDPREHRGPHRDDPREHKDPHHGEPREHKGPHHDDPREDRGPHHDDPREDRGPHHGEREHRGPKHGEEPREHRGPRHGEEPREHRGPKHGEEPREHRGPKHGEEPREHRGPKHGEEPREHRGPKHDEEREQRRAPQGDDEKKYRDHLVVEDQPSQKSRAKEQENVEITLVLFDEPTN